MKTLTIFKTLGPIDLKNVRRDSLLLWLPLIPIIQALVIRIGFPIAGLTPLPFGHLLVVALLGSLIGPQVALFLASFAENKVAGFAMFKFLNSLLFIPIVAFFLPGNWQLLAGFLSPFWSLKVFWLAAQGQSYWPYLLAGLFVNLITLMLLLQRFQKVVHR